MKYKFSTRLLAIAAALCIFSAPAGALAYEDLPVAMDTSDIFADDAAIESACARVSELADALSGMQGSLTTAENLAAFLADYYEAANIVMRVSTYAQLGYAADITDTYSINLIARAQALSNTVTSAVAFLDGEICALDMDARRALIGSPLLSEYSYVLEYLLDETYVPLSGSEMTAILNMTAAADTTNIYNSLVLLELPAPVMQLADGSEITLDAAGYSAYVSAAGRTRGEISAASDVYYSRFKPFLNTLSAIFNTHVSTAWAQAQANNYDSTLAYQMDMYDMPTEIYDMAISAAHSMADDFQRYTRSRAALLGYDSLYMYELYNHISAYRRGSLSFDETAQGVRDALSVLGEEYISCFDELMTSGHIDVYYDAGEFSNAMTINTPDRTLPYMMLAFRGALGEDVTLAHESGHAVYSMLASGAQPTCNINMPVFTQEVASTVNEYLYLFACRDNATGDDERLYYTEELINNFIKTCILQSMYSEFEQFAYESVESGGALTGDMLSGKWAELSAQFYGDGITLNAGMEDSWANLPHFEQATYYVYQYSTSACYALSLAQAIYSGEEGALENYIAFLKSGSSDDPVALLRAAGADPLNSATYEATAQAFSGWIDDYQRLVDGMY